MLWDWGCPFLPYSLLYLHAQHKTWHVVVDLKKCLLIIQGISGDFRWESFWTIWTNLNENQRTMIHIFPHGVCIARGRQMGVVSISLSHHKSRAFFPDPEQHRDAERWPTPTRHCSVLLTSSVSTGCLARPTPYRMPTACFMFSRLEEGPGHPLPLCCGQMKLQLGLEPER